MDDIFFDILFCVMFVLVPFVALKLLSYSGVSLRKFSIPSFFIIFYITADYIGIFPLYFKMNLDFIPRGIVEKHIILKMFFFSSAALFIIIFGFIYAHQIFGFNCGDIKDRLFVKANNAQSFFAFFLFMICGIVLWAYLQQIQTIALMKALSGDIAGANFARSEMGTNFPGAYWRYEIFFRRLLDYCVIFFFADFLITHRRISGLLFGIVFVAAVFSATMAIEKGPFINLLIMLYVAYVIYKGGNYWQSITKYVVLIIFGSLILFDIYFMGNAGIVASLQNISSRIFTGQIAPAYFYLDLFPHKIDYLWGRSLPNPGGLLPFQSYRLTVEIMRFISPEGFEKGIIGSAPTVFWGEMYANFGVVGVIFPSFLVGIGLFAVSHILTKFPLSPAFLAATVFLAMHYRNLTATGFSSYLFDTTFIAIAIVTSLSLVLGNSISKNLKSMQPD